MNHISATTIIEGLEAKGLRAESWHTGGGCYTIYATRSINDEKDIRDYEQVAAFGPGTADGYRLSDGLSIGIETEAGYDEDPLFLEADATEQDIIDLIAQAATCEAGEWVK